MQAPRTIIPDYSHIQQRGAIAGRAIEGIGGIVAGAVQKTGQEIEKRRDLKTDYKAVRSMVLEQQEKYSLSDKQADAMMSRLKYKNTETVEAYEKRIAPVLANMSMYDEYQKTADYQFNMPDPFLDRQSFMAAMEKDLAKRKERELGGVAEDFTGMKTKDEALEYTSGRMAGRPVSEQELSQFPAYRGMPTKAGMAQGELAQRKEAREQEKHEVDMAGGRLETQAAGQEMAQKAEMHPVEVDYKKAQAEALRRNATTNRLKALSAQKSKAAVDELKNLDDISRLEIAATEMLKDISRENDEGGLNEEWLNMKNLAKMLKEKRNEIGKQIQPSPEAKSLIAGIDKHLSKFITDPNDPGNTELGYNVTTQKLFDFAQSKGVKISSQKIRQALEGGYSAEDIAERIIMGAGKQPTVGGRVGR